MGCLDDAHRHAAGGRTAPTTSAERFSQLRQKILRYAALEGLRVAVADGPNSALAKPRDRIELAQEISNDLQELEQIVRAADDVLHANTANAKHASRTELSTRLSLWRHWVKT
jgi:hypothetical protein